MLLGGEACDAVARDVADMLCHVCDQAHTRCEKLLTARAKDGFLERLGAHEFVELSRAIEGFVADCQRVCGRRSTALRSCLQAQVRTSPHAIAADFIRISCCVALLSLPVARHAVAARCAVGVLTGAEVRQPLPRRAQDEAESHPRQRALEAGRRAGRLPGPRQPHLGVGRAQGARARAGR